MSVLLLPSAARLCHAFCRNFWMAHAPSPVPLYHSVSVECLGLSVDFKFREAIRQILHRFTATLMSVSPIPCLMGLTLSTVYCILSRKMSALQLKNLCEYSELGQTVIAYGIEKLKF